MFRMGPFWNEGISTVSFHELSTTCTMYIAMFRLSLTTFFRFNNTEDDFSAKLRQPIGQRLCNVRMRQKKLIGPVLFSYYEESLVSSNLNSKLFRFHSAHPTVHSVHLTIGLMRNILKQWDIRNTQYVLTCHCYSKMNFLISGHEGLDQL